jgi:hypothetical protein
MVGEGDFLDLVCSQCVPTLPKTSPKVYIYPHILQLSLFHIQVTSELTEGVLQWTSLNRESLTPSVNALLVI